jgi:hypothetical protein
MKEPYHLGVINKEDQGKFGQITDLLFTKNITFHARFNSGEVHGKFRHTCSITLTCTETEYRDCRKELEQKGILL